MISATPKTMLAVVESCITSPFRIARIAERLRVGDLGGRDEPRPDRAERVERLAAHPLAVGELEIAAGDVVHADVARHGVERVLDGDAARARRR